MRYLTIYRPSGGVEGGMPDPAHMAEMNRLIQDMLARGVLVSTEPLTAREHCARITLADGKFTVSDEPNRAGGFAILNFASKADAIEGCKQFLKAAGDGVVEMRQILEFAPQPA
jgi:hypothetical protein